VQDVVRVIPLAIPTAVGMDPFVVAQLCASSQTDVGGLLQGVRMTQSGLNTNAPKMERRAI